MEINKELDKLLKQVEKPARYIGGEIHSAVKNPDQVRLRFGFAFPDTYEIGMSYMGLQLLYSILNQDEDIYCERVFAPAMDMEARMRKAGMDLFTLETKTSVKELDFLGFTLQYELSFTNVVNMLDLGKIPILAAERKEEDRSSTAQFSFPATYSFASPRRMPLNTIRATRSPAVRTPPIPAAISCMHAMPYVSPWPIYNPSALPISIIHFDTLVVASVGE